MVTEDDQICSVHEDKKAVCASCFIVVDQEEVYKINPVLKINGLVNTIRTMIYESLLVTKDYPLYTN